MFTTRGFDVTDCKLLANIICDLLDNIEDENIEARTREAAAELCNRHPVYRAA
jgi:glycine hydroxymethyltransferase